MSNKRNVMTCMVMGAGMLAAGAGCVGDGAAPASDPSVAIAKVALASGTTVSFYETSPGALTIDQLTPDSVSALDVGGMTAVEFYQKIAPGQTVPAPLVAAQGRANAAHTARGLPLAMHGGAASHPAPQITSFDFESKYCFNNASQWQFINCHASPFLTGDHQGVHFDIDALQSDICVNSGKVRWSATADDETVFSLDVPEHFCLIRNYDSGWSNADTMTVTVSLETATANYGLAVKWNH
jgi:hypothetical protein